MSLDYNTATGRLGGYVAFRYYPAGAGSVPFEALVPLSPYDDHKSFMYYDNIEGFATGLALVNPGGNLTSRVTIRAADLSGTIITTDTLSIPPGGHPAFVLEQRMPSLARRIGTLYVESDTSRLSALGIRMNVVGGGAFTSIPIMNWSGMFP
jgi:hypothetical protein